MNTKGWTSRVPGLGQTKSLAIDRPSHWTSCVLASLFLFALSCPAATTNYTATLAVATGTTNGMKLVVNSDVRTWTNAVYAPATQIFTNATAGGSAQNLIAHLALHPVSSVKVSASGTTNVVLSSSASISVSVTGAWATVSFSTNTITPALVVRIPFSVETSANRSNIVTAIADELLGPFNGNPISSANGNGGLTNAFSGQTNTINMRGGEQYSVSYVPLTVSGFANISPSNSMTAALVVSNAASTNWDASWPLGIHANVATNFATVTNGQMTKVEFHTMGLGPTSAVVTPFVLSSAPSGSPDYTSKLYAYFLMDDTTNITEQVAGSGFTHYFGTNSVDSGQLGNCLNFFKSINRRSTDSYYQFNNSTNSTNFSGRFWIKVTDTNDTDHAIFDFGNWNLGFSTYSFGVGDGIDFTTQSDAGNTTVTSTNILDNNWHRVFFWYVTSNYAAIRLDMGAAITNSTPDGLYDPGGPWSHIQFGGVVGECNGIGGCPDIFIDDFAIWRDYTPTEADMDYDWNGGGGRGKP